MRKSIFDLQEARNHASKKIDALVSESEKEGKPFTPAQQLEYDTNMAAFHALEGSRSGRLASAKYTLEQNLFKQEACALSSSLDGRRRNLVLPGERMLTHEYANDFFTWVGSNGQKMSAALQEGTGSLGGYVVPVVVQDQVVPLAPPDMGVRSIATIIPTSSDLKIPRQTAISSATAKAEGDGTGSNLFTESEPTLEQFTLSAFMAGVLHGISWELAQDVPSFQQFAVGDMLLAQQIYEGNLYVNGTGTGQAQGLIGNTGTGVTGVLVGSDTYTSELLDATFDVMGKLKTPYHPNASWLMSRATSVVLRKAQKEANLFEPVFVRDGGKDFLHGYPVTYDNAMPVIAASATPILFGDFKQGYVIGDRGGAGISVKILDQPKATEGLIVLLAYRRTDGRVRRSEAIQAITLHS